MSGLVESVSILNRAGIEGDLWVNGSFLTEKLNPEDVDIVLKVQDTFFDQMSSSQLFVATWWSRKNLRRGFFCDCYLFVEFETTDSRYAAGVSARKYWFDLFGNSRSGEPKGIAVLNLPFINLQFSK